MICSIWQIRREAACRIGVKRVYLNVFCKILLAPDRKQGAGRRTVERMRVHAVFTNFQEVSRTA
jgi:hypothetical protein